MKTRSKWFTDYETSRSTKMTIQHSDAVLLHITVSKDSFLTPHSEQPPMQLHIILTCMFGCLNRALVGLFKNISLLNRNSS